MLLYGFLTKLFWVRRKCWNRFCLLAEIKSFNGVNEGNVRILSVIHRKSMKPMLATSFKDGSKGSDIAFNLFQVQVVQILLNKKA